MPPFTRYSIKLALLYFAAFFLGEIANALMGLSMLPPIPLFSRTLLHLFFVGGVTQMIFGVAVWLFPVSSRETPRGAPWLQIATLVLLNGGLLLRLITEPMRLQGGGLLWGRFLVLSAALQWLGMCAFLILIWPRIHAKPKKKE
jgi:hypothetical protein